MEVVSDELRIEKYVVVMNKSTVNHINISLELNNKHTHFKVFLMTYLIYNN